MRKISLFIAAMLISFIVYSQENLNDKYQNAGQRLLENKLPKGITIGGYAQIDYKVS